MLVVGSSLMVYSAFRLSKAAKTGDGRLAILSAGPTRADDMADLKVTWRSLSARSLRTPRHVQRVIHIQRSDNGTRLDWQADSAQGQLFVWSFERCHELFHMVLRVKQTDVAHADMPVCNTQLMTLHAPGGPIVYYMCLAGGGFGWRGVGQDCCAPSAADTKGGCLITCTAAAALCLVCLVPNNVALAMPLLAVRWRWRGQLRKVWYVRHGSIQYCLASTHCRIVAIEGKRGDKRETG